MDVKREKYRIGLVIDYINSEYTTALVQGMKTACKDFDIEMLVFCVAEIHSLAIPYDYQCAAVLSFVTTNNLDGVILATGSLMHYQSKADLISTIHAYKPLPVVSLSVEIPDTPSIIVDCYAAYEAILSELIEKQLCRRFCIVGVRGNSSEVKFRTKTIKTILQKKYIPSGDVTLLKSIFDYGTTLQTLNDFYKQKNNEFDYDAIIALNDEMAFAAMDFCKNIGKSVPEDVAIVGFDDIERSSFSTPALTTITQDLTNQSYSAVIYMKEILDGVNNKLLKKIDAKPVMRDSTRRKNGVTGIVDREASFTSTEWYAKKSQLYHITRYYTNMQTDMSVAQYKARLNDDMKTFGIKGAAVVLYESPVEMPTPFDYFNLPHKASIFAAYDYSTNYDSNNVKRKVIFDPNEYMLPEDVLYYDDGEMYVMAIYHGTFQYGYIVFRPGSFDMSIYDLLTKFVGSIIASVFTYEHEQSKFKAKNKQLDIIASTDELTGLLNRRGLYDLGQTTLKFARQMYHSGLVVFCDMDGLKKINDSYGHEAGDMAIRAQGTILKNNFRSNDVVARLGGDEFAIISPGLTKEAFARIRKQIEKDCDEWQKKNDTPYKISISMGAIGYPSQNSNYSIVGLLSEADSILYDEKTAKKAK